MTASYEVRRAAQALASHAKSVIESVPEGKRLSLEIAIQDVEQALRRQGPLSPNSFFGRLAMYVTIMFFGVVVTTWGYGSLRSSFAFFPPADGFPLILIGVGAALGAWVAWQFDRHERH